MLAWAIRGMTFVTNLLLLTGFALLYDWLQRTQFQIQFLKRFRGICQILLTIGFLGFFQLASVFRIMEAHNRKGFGWSYLGFQIGVLIIALFFEKSRGLFPVASFLVLNWYWLLPNLVWWGYAFVFTLVLMRVAEKFGRQIIDRPLRYYPFCFLFAAPFMWANWVSLRGIEVGWLWEIFASLVVFYLIWFIYYELKLRNQRHALLLYEARQDNLTQLYNFRVFNEDLNRAFRDYHKNGTRYLLYTFDVDHFKRVNDRYGHLEGNAVLRKVAAELKQIVPEISSHAEAYRVGGEEFSILVFDVETQHCSANMAANRVRKAIGNLNFTTQQGEQFQITISMGQDQIDAEDQNYLDLYKRADKRLYRSKEAGRNRVTTSDVG
ncbi:GGDEF domain-containing protein [Secundilactobacillus silagei]|uniref:Diguanylate cyclase n=1 Tax=Secundilactobacillus silagei JCM 19001 TaxID=1302250 RepID=A0A1Z5H397_9LACO|nr:GGDEF domain-containing protein [Secundilactobacillus silagei]TDG70436.1 hypothetical protein C5L25_001626 [Secundilactobacillus silagei JCM 19001]GAT17793.1 diguanylate cyclase [Secundilactobacillus silagei JCM 19001]